MTISGCRAEFTPRSQIAVNSPVQDLVNLAPCHHTVERLFAEKRYGKMVDVGCELREKECVICGTPVDAYTPLSSIGNISARQFGHEKGGDVDLPYPGLSAVFEPIGRCDWSQIFNSRSDLCRKMEFQSITDNSVLKDFSLCGYWNGRVAMVVTFKTDSFFEKYLRVHGMSDVNDFLCKTDKLKELKAIFNIIACNNKIPADKFNQIFEIVERGACDPSPEPEGRGISSHSSSEVSHCY